MGFYRLFFRGFVGVFWAKEGEMKAERSHRQGANGAYKRLRHGSERAPIEADP